MTGFDPAASAAANARPKPAPLPKRFYTEVAIAPEAGGFAVTLDGRPVLTPARARLALPRAELAEAVADEWRAQAEVIDPATMPLTRLANVALDAVAPAIDAVRADILRYAGSDLLCYRAGEPDGLVARQSGHWDPVLAWARETLGARFILAEGVVFVAQPPATLAAIEAALASAGALETAALQVATTLTGSVLLALALWRGRLDADAAWAAAHVDEDWNIQYWGEDEEAATRRAFRRAEFDAAAMVLRT